MSEYFTDADLDAREKAACHHKYVRTFSDAVDISGRQVERYRCTECGRNRSVTRPGDEEWFAGLPERLQPKGGTE